MPAQGTRAGEGMSGMMIGFIVFGVLIIVGPLVGILIAMYCCGMGWKRVCECLRKEQERVEAAEAAEREAEREARLAAAAQQTVIVYGATQPPAPLTPLEQAQANRARMENRAAA